MHICNIIGYQFFRVAMKKTYSKNIYAQTSTDLQNTSSALPPIESLAQRNPKNVYP